jgi:3-hydroxyisobutyrate dehydrogenase-like beta-hydroxyacid dehydrogenase
VGFVGLGQMGAPMASHLADWPGGLVVCDARPSAIAALAQDGALVATSPRAVAEQAELISVMVRDDVQVREVVLGDDGVVAAARPGTVVAIHSTIRPDTAPALAEAAGIDLCVLADVVRHSDATMGGPASVMLRDTALPVSRADEWYEPLTHVRDMGETDLALALGLGRELGVELPLAKVALDRLAAGLGVPHDAAGLPADHRGDS